MANCKFVISLDFELIWGVREKHTIESYGKQVLGVHTALPKMLDLFYKYDIKATIAPVGFLYLQNKQELLKHIPQIIPTYNDPNVSPYNGYIDSLTQEDNDRYHFAPHLIENIKNRPNHEICTHTLSHYNALCAGQTVEAFRADLSEAIAIAKEKDISISSIIFPRNQCNREYLQVCKELNITVFRSEDLLIRNGIINNLDRYLPLSRHQFFAIDQIMENGMANVRGGEHYRPNISKGKISEKILAYLRANRVKNSMSYAAKHSLVYHIWYHPHEFGTYQDEKLHLLEKLLKHYQQLHEKYGFESITMKNLAKEAATLPIQTYKNACVLRFATYTSTQRIAEREQRKAAKKARKF